MEFKMKNVLEVNSSQVRTHTFNMHGDLVVEPGSSVAFHTSCRVKPPVAETGYWGRFMVYASHPTTPTDTGSSLVGILGPAYGFSHQTVQCSKS